MPHQGVQDPKVTGWHSQLSHQRVLVGLQELCVSKLIEDRQTMRFR